MIEKMLTAPSNIYSQMSQDTSDDGGGDDKEKATNYNELIILFRQLTTIDIRLPV